MKAKNKIQNVMFSLAMLIGLAGFQSVAIELISHTQAHAAVVRSVDVRGNSRVDNDTIRNYVNIKPGSSFNSATIDAGVKRLYATGLFEDVSITQSGSRLIINVDEYPIVNQVLFQGNKKLKDDALAGRVQLKSRGVFSQALMSADEDSIRASYEAIGRGDAVVSSRTMDLGKGRVNVVFDIKEGGRTKIKSINFVGNNAFSDRRLRDVISTKRSNILSFLLRNDIYDDNRLRADESVLSQYYFDRGYADFRVISSVGDLNDAENEYNVTITVDEGERYNFGDISIESTVSGIDSDVYDSLVTTREGKVYNARKVEKSVVALTERAAGQGFAFAKVTPRGNRNFEARTIDIVYSIDQGERAYIERIEVLGNSRTRDYVIRREFDLSEGDAFNQVLVQRAKRRLEALGFFERVEISTAPGSNSDQVILIVNVVEKSTGEFSVGAGYTTGGSDAGPSVEGGITERNFLGRGQYINASVGGGKNNRNYALSFTEPYFLGNRISAGFDLFYNTNKNDDYKTALAGGSIRFGLPITEALSAQFAYNLSRDKYTYTDDASAVCPGVNCSLATATQEAIALSPWIKSSLSAGLTYNTVDSRVNAHDGIFATATIEIAGLGGNAKYFKATAETKYFKTLNEEFDIVGVLGAKAGHIQAFTSGGLRQFDLFKASDQIVKGFAYNGFGPANSAVSGASFLGGTTYFAASAEVNFPLPVIPESFGVRGAVFGDIGTLYGNSLTGVDAATTSIDWRASVGASLIWQSPFGPLRVSYAVPVMKTDYDQEERFSFGMKGSF